MRALRIILSLLLFIGILVLSGESHAVIFKYLDGKGEPVYVDDLTKVPEQERSKAVIVTGQEERELRDDAERAAMLAARQAAVEQGAPTHAQARDGLRGRFIRSGVAIGLVVALWFVLANIDALKEQAKLLRRLRVGLLTGMVLFLGVSHAMDVVGLFSTMGDRVASPVAGIKERQAEKGKKAADAYKAMDQALGGHVQQEADRIQKQFEEAEKGR